MDRRPCYSAALMLAIRRAMASDEIAIQRLIEELDLMRPSLALSGFWVAKQDGEVVGIAHIERAGEALFLSSVGVRKDLQHQGIGSQLLRRIFSESDQAIYLYTVIPEFFRRLGFFEVKEPDAIPERGLFGCDACEPGKCVCMMRPADAS